MDIDVLIELKRSFEKAIANEERAKGTQFVWFVMVVNHTTGERRVSHRTSEEKAIKDVNHFLRALAPNPHEVIGFENNNRSKDVWFQRYGITIVCSKEQIT